MREEAGTIGEGTASNKLRVVYMNKELEGFVSLKGHVQELCLSRLVPDY